MERALSVEFSCEELGKILFDWWNSLYPGALENVVCHREIDASAEAFIRITFKAPFPPELAHGIYPCIFSENFHDEWMPNDRAWEGPFEESLNLIEISRYLAGYGEMISYASVSADGKCRIIFKNSSAT